MDLPKFFRIFIVGMSLTAFCVKGLASDSNTVFVLQLDDATINPVTAEYIMNAITQAENQKATALLLKLDTPGGLLSSTRSIVKRILASEVPVVVYIYPSGSRAGSAGVFITYASHIAAMAPSTNIGAAHPVEFGQEPRHRQKEEDLQEFRDLLKELKKKKEKGSPAEQTKEKASKQNAAEEELPSDEDPMSSKILNDTVAFIRALAQLRHRNVEWAVKSVAKSSSITETEALEKGVVEIIAKDEHDLLEKLDGRIVRIKDQDLELHTKDAIVKTIAMDFRQSFFNILANPNVAYIFMILGFYGLLYEITHPGFGIPGIAGIGRSCRVASPIVA